MDTWKTPKPGESLAGYVLRLRKALNLTQFELAHQSGIHSRSVGKIERGLTVKINRRTLQGLAIALGVPQEYLDAVTKGEEVPLVTGVKFCPQCWNPGNPADPIWSNIRAKYCYLCGTQLRTNCTNCGELVLSLRHRFCPLCGFPYKEMGKT